MSHYDVCPNCGDSVLNGVCSRCNHDYQQTDTIGTLKHFAGLLQVYSGFYVPRDEMNIILERWAPAGASYEMILDELEKNQIIMKVESDYLVIGSVTDIAKGRMKRGY